MLKRVQFSPTGGSGNTKKIMKLNEYMLANILHINTLEMVMKLFARMVGMLSVLESIIPFREKKNVYSEIFKNICENILKIVLLQRIVYLKACQERKDKESGFVFATWLTNVLHVERHFIINNVKRA